MTSSRAAVLWSIFATGLFSAHLSAADGGETPPAKPEPVKKTVRENPDNLELVKRIHALIVEKSTEKEAAAMKLYTVNTNGGKALNMIPVPAGEFLMGSPENEKGRKPDEGPQVKVKVDPFWMGSCEVTWGHYWPYVLVSENRYAARDKQSPMVDAVSGPTELIFVPVEFGENHPVTDITRHGALKFCQWLSARTGQYYRLPTEAEWEYAARAGTTTTWPWGEDATKLGEYAWYFENCEALIHPVGQKRPNAWGFYDLLGNAGEWTLDQYDAARYSRLASGQPVLNPFNKTTSRHPIVLRGGSADSDAPECRPASRASSSKDWEENSNGSRWHLRYASIFGFRLVRPLKIPSPEEMHAIWNADYPEGKK